MVTTVLPASSGPDTALHTRPASPDTLDSVDRKKQKFFEGAGSMSQAELVKGMNDIVQVSQGGGSPGRRFPT